MRTRTYFCLAAAALLLALGVAGCYKEVHQTLTINEDGTAKIVMELVFDRAVIEEEVENMQRNRDREDGGMDGIPDAPPEGDLGGDIEPPEKPAPKPEPKKDEKKPELTPAQKDAKLAEDVKAMWEEDRPWGIETPEGVTFKIDAVEVKADAVRVVTTMTFKDLKTLLTDYSAVLPDGEGLRLEKDEKGKLRLTVTLAGAGRGRDMETGIDETLAGVTDIKLIGSYKYVMPGKVLSSTLSDVKGNTASFKFDASNDESMAALKKLLAGGIVIVSEPGKLKMDDFPLDSAKLAAAREEEGPAAAGHDLPVVDAAPGFRVKALSVSTSSVHYFDDAARFYNDLRMMMNGEQANLCVVHARLSAPRERLLLSLDGVTALKAVDDKKREVKPFVMPDGGSGARNIRGYTGGGREVRLSSVDIELLLALPAPDAEALEEVRGEAVVVTFGAWKEHAVKEPKADPKAAIDLGDVLGGASMVIKEIKTAKARGGRPQDAAPVYVLEVTGPPAVQFLEFALRAGEAPAEPNDFSNGRYSSERTSKAGDKTVRALTLFAQPGELKEGKPSLVVRYPGDMKRERVTFTLEALDLF